MITPDEKKAIIKAIDDGEVVASQFGVIVDGLP